MSCSYWRCPFCKQSNHFLNLRDIDWHTENCHEHKELKKSLARAEREKEEILRDSNVANNCLKNSDLSLKQNTIQQLKKSIARCEAEIHGLSWRSWMRAENERKISTKGKLCKHCPHTRGEIHDEHNYCKRKNC